MRWLNQGLANSSPKAALLFWTAMMEEGPHQDGAMRERVVSLPSLSLSCSLTFFLAMFDFYIAKRSNMFNTMNNVIKYQEIIYEKNNNTIK